ncbi:MAG: transcription factor like protein [Caulobacter sp. 12-67-6]|nr:MAG: transcription factor like protein [Caulobacter sp. 12-67-6]
MVLHIANPEVCALVKLFAQERGVTLSQAMKIAVKEALALEAAERARADAADSLANSPRDR